MADHSKIEWCDSTFNPWIGCTKISPACDHCYAAVSTPSRTLGIEWGAGKPRRRTSLANWKQPLQWNARKFYECMPCGWRGDSPTFPDDGGLWTCPACNSDAVINARRRVFCASLADVFDNEVDPLWRRDLFDLIAATPNLDWLLLTKRIGNARQMLEQQERRAADNYREAPYLGSWLNGFPRNVWLGATICNQAEADRDIPKLLATPASVRFLSIEPLLGDVNLWPSAFLPCIRAEHVIMDPTTGAYECCRECDYTGVSDEIGIDWIIVGGESGHGARPMNPEWARTLRDQCAAAGLPFMFKQWGEWVSVSEVAGEGAHHQFPDGRTVRCIGKKLAGRLLDGVEHNGYPVVR